MKFIRVRAAAWLWLWLGASVSYLGAQTLPSAMPSEVQAPPTQPSTIRPPITNAPAQTPPTLPNSTIPAVETSNPSVSTPVANTPGPDVYRTMNLQQLMNQDVTSVSKEPEPYEDAPAAIDVITSDEIERSGASSIPEALRLAPSLDVAQDNSHDWNISARGFNANLSNKLLVLMDGRTLYTPLYGGVLWNVQSYLLEDIDRIEVISGPGGTLWGANAVNGVINITSKSADQTQGWYVEGDGGTELRDEGAIRYGGTLAPNVYYRVYGMYFDRNNEDFANGSPASDFWDQGQGGFRVDSDATTSDHLTVQGDYYSGDQDVPTGGTTEDSGGNFLGRWTHAVSEDSNMTLQTYYDRTHLSFPYAAPLGTLVDDLDTYDIDFQHNFSVGDRNKVVWGLGYRFTHESDTNAPQILFLPPDQDQNLFNGFVQDEITLQKDLFLTLGTKVEHNDYTGFEVEPSGRLQWNVAHQQMIWAAVSRAVRTPSRYDEDLEVATLLPKPLPQSILSGSTDFTSEDLIAYELGYRAELSSQVSASISTYYNDYTNLRSLTPSPSGPPSYGYPLYFQNNLEGDTYGLELNTTYQVLDWWQLRGGYDLLEEDIHVKPGQVDADNALNETSDPKNQFSAHSSMDLPENIDFDTGLRWVDTRPVNNGSTAGTVPSYFELDARLAWHPTKNLELSVVGQNLLHAYHVEYGFPDSTQEAIQRSVYGKITWRF